jgi:alkylation response protein AidB-like acyl-CoA dehydrogenase
VPATLTDEQQLLRETAAALARRVGVASLADLPRAVPPGSPIPGGDAADAASDAAGGVPDAESWRLVADAGWTALRLPEAAGGLGAGGVDTALVVEELAARLAPVPLLGQAVLVPGLLTAAGASSAVTEAVAAGELRLALVLGPDLQTTEVGSGGDARGGIAFDARGAHAGLVVTGEWPAMSVRAVALGPALPAADFTRELRPALDSSHGGVDVGDIGTTLDPDLLLRAHALALVGLSADLLGVMRSALDVAVAYARDRVQFGVPVGSFQAVQHLCADALVTVESARSATWYAAWAVDELRPEEAVLAARIAKAWCSRAGVEVCETAVQVLGGIGMTWEHLAHVHLRRALLDRTVLGDEHVQHERIGHARLAGVGA